MTNTLAVFLAVAALGFVIADIALFEMENILFLGRKFLDLIIWMAFWR